MPFGVKSSSGALSDLNRPAVLSSARARPCRTLDPPLGAQHAVDGLVRAAGRRGEPRVHKLARAADLELQRARRRGHEHDRRRRLVVDRLALRRGRRRRRHLARSRRAGESIPLVRCC